jgi:hypothetical protein
MDGPRHFVLKVNALDISETPLAHNFIGSLF